ncbi:MAG: hypothetical protein JNL90_20200 [Planctomycetes bacterium]|nr:hypothetical protein [Planctomycetota bacterium]
MNDDEPCSDLSPADDALLERVVVGELAPDAAAVVARAAESPAFAAALAATLALQGSLDSFGELARATVAEAAAPPAPPAAARRAPLVPAPARRWLPLLAAAALLVAALLWPRERAAEPAPTGDPALLGAAAIDFGESARTLAAGREWSFVHALPPGGWYTLTWRAPGDLAGPPLLERRLGAPRYVPTAADVARLPAGLAEVEVRVVACAADGALLAAGALRCSVVR